MEGNTSELVKDTVHNPTRDIGTNQSDVGYSESWLDGGCQEESQFAMSEVVDLIDNVNDRLDSNYGHFIGSHGSTAHITSQDSSPADLTDKVASTETTEHKVSSSDRESGVQDQIRHCESYEINIAALQPTRLMTIPVTVNNFSFDALIDTGACNSFTSSDVVQKLSLSLQDASSQPIKGLGPDCVTSDGSVIMTVNIHSVFMREHCFTVLKDDAIRYSLILGIDFLKSNNLIVDLGNRSVSQAFPESKGTWTLCSSNSSASSCMIYNCIPVVASQNCNIKRGQTKYIDVEVYNPAVSLISNSEHPSEYYYDGELEDKLTTKIQGVDGILYWREEGNQVMIMKSTDTTGKTTRIRKGDVLGRLHTVPTDTPHTTELTNHNKNDLPTEWTIDRIKEEITLGSHLSGAQQDQIHDLLLENKEVMSNGAGDIGLASVTEHKIELYDTTPIREKPRRFPEPVVDEIEKECERLKSLGVIEDSCSPYAAAIVPVRKRTDGSLRICLDYRKINAVTKPDRFPMPNLSDLIFSLHGTTYFTSLDMVSGYYQIPLEDSSKELTAFSTSRNHYQFKRLPFGLKNAPAAFQRHMQAILSGFDRKKVLIYLDDVLIMEKSFSAHLALVNEVLQVLTGAGVKIKLNKCHWFEEQVPFLGHIVGRNGISKQEEYTKSILDFPKPQTVGDMRRFLGLLNFQRKYIPDCSAISKPLSQQVTGHKKKRIEWSPDMEEAFVTLKHKMQEDLQLAYPDYSPDAAKLELSVDASGVGAGGCLSQVQEGEPRIIGYASIAFSKAQLSYSTLEKELAAIRWAVKTFKPFFYCLPFTLYTDHRPLVFMHNMSRENARILRTLNELADFDFQIIYRPGKDNLAADVMSRLPEVSLTCDASYDPKYLPEGIKVLEEMPGGGDSLIDSLYCVLEHHRQAKDPSIRLPESCIKLRELLVNELLVAPSKYKLKLTKEVQQILILAKQPQQIPVPEVILAFSTLYNLTVLVHHGMDYPVMHTLTPEASQINRVHLQCLGGFHYNALCETLLYDSSYLNETDIFVIDHDSHVNDMDNIASDTDLHVAEHASGEVTNMLDCSSLFNISTVCSFHSNFNGNLLLHIGQLTYCALLDTGAQVSVIGESAWQQIKQCKSSFRELEHADHNSRLEGIGQQSSPIIDIVEITFSIAHAGPPITAPFAIVSDAALPCCVLLGLNVIEQVQTIVNFSDSTMSLIIDNETYVHSINLKNTSLISSVATCELSDYTHDDSSLGCSVLLTDEFIYQLQEGSFALCKLKGLLVEKVSSKRWTHNCLKRFKAHESSLRVAYNMLVYDTGSRSVPVVPFLFLVELALKIHSKMAHIGRHKLIYTLRQVCFHPSINEVGRDITSSCAACQLSKIGHQTVKPPVTKVETTTPFELVGIDVMQLPVTSQKHVACVVVVDYYSKWLSVAALKNKKAETVSHTFEHQILPRLPRCPLRIVSDNGPEFRSTTFRDMLCRYGITHTFTTPNNPTSAGAVERSNRTITEFMRSLTSTSEEWDVVLARAVMVYNTTLHSSINTSPSECLLSSSHDLTNPPILEQDMKQHWTAGHLQYSPFEVGQHVVKKIVTQGRLVADKLKHRYWGPFMVTKANQNEVTYEITKVNDPNKGQVLRAHHQQLKIWHVPPDYLFSHPCYHYIAGTQGVENESLPSHTSLTRKPHSHLLLHSDSGDSQPETRSMLKITSDSANYTGNCPSRRLRAKPFVKRTSRIVKQDKPLENLPCSEAVRDNSKTAHGINLHSTPINLFQASTIPPVSVSIISVPESSSSSLTDTLTRSIDNLAQCDNVLDQVILQLSNTLQEVITSQGREITSDRAVSGFFEINTQLDSPNSSDSAIVNRENARTESFSGFQDTPASENISGRRSDGHALRLLEKSLCDTISRVTAARKANRDKILMLKRAIAWELDTDGNTSDICSTKNNTDTVPDSAIPSVPHTRSKGPVGAIPNVQRYILERRRKHK